jgi:hypothetical protein
LLPRKNTIIEKLRALSRRTSNEVDDTNIESSCPTTSRWLMLGVFDGHRLMSSELSAEFIIGNL